MEDGRFYKQWEYRQWLVICVDDEHEYTLATREVFTSKIDADKYAATISPTRHPILVGCADILDIIRRPTGRQITPEELAFSGEVLGGEKRKIREG